MQFKKNTSISFSRKTYCDYFPDLFALALIFRGVRYLCASYTYKEISIICSTPKDGTV